jgi:hypothetical protein
VTTPREADLSAVRDVSGSHRDVTSALVLAGWVLCGAGDWAVALRSPDGQLAARVCPFDPAYDAFLDLCRRCPDNPYLPRVELGVPLHGGGSLTVMEFLPEAPEDEALALLDRWRRGEGDDALRAVNATALVVDAECRVRVPWWDGIDLNPHNVRRSGSHGLVLIDVFCLDGAALYEQVREDPAVVRRRIPADQRQHLLEIPYLARETSTEDLAALRDAWTPEAPPSGTVGGLP